MKRVLDLYCCAGGASEGYRRAGASVLGVDIERQKSYPFEHVKGDAIEYLLQHGREFDFIHASPPCQAFTPSTNQWRGEGRSYIDLVAPTRDALISVGVPYVIENVPGSPLIDPVTLCGSMFQLRTYRHRLFECSFRLRQPTHYPHDRSQAKMGRAPKEDENIQVVGHFSGVPFARRAMGIPWMGQGELAQAIPPAYTEWIFNSISHLL